MYVTDTTSETFSARLLVLDNQGASNAITKTVKAYDHRPVAGFEIANPPGGDQGDAGAVHYPTIAAAYADVANSWEARDVVYGDLQSLGTPLPQTVSVVIRSKKIVDATHNWYGLTTKANQSDLTMADGTSAVSSSTPAKPSGYADHNFSYDPEGQEWTGDLWPAWFGTNPSWGIRYLYVAWDDGSATEQVLYAEADWSACGGDVAVAHTYTVTVDGMVKTITVTAEDWLGYRSAPFSRTVLFKRGEETTASEI